MCKELFGRRLGLRRWSSSSSLSFFLLGGRELEKIRNYGELGWRWRGARGVTRFGKHFFLLLHTYVHIIHTYLLSSLRLEVNDILTISYLLIITSTLVNIS